MSTRRPRRGLRVTAGAMVASATIAGILAVRTETGGAVQHAGPGLAVAATPQLVGGVRLHGQTLAGRAVFYVEGAKGLARVRYFVDGRPVGGAGRAPYPRAVDLTQLETGTHSVLVTFKKARVARRFTATFRIQNLAVSPSGSSSSGCTSSSPCNSFDRAYHLAKPGQVVEVASGAYAPQTVTSDTAKAAATANVVFRPAAGESATIGNELRIAAAYVEFRNLSVGGDWEIDPPASHVTLRNVNATNFYIDSATDVNVVGGSLGPTTNLNSQIKALDGGIQPARILIQGVTFHDYVRTDPSVHMECLQVLSASQLTIRQSRFRSCAVMDLYFSQFGSAGATRDVLVENNFFDSPTSGGFNAVHVSSQLGVPPTNFMFRYNSSLDSMVIDTSVGVNNVAFIANVGPRPQYDCDAGIEYAYNVWDNARCSSTDTQAPLGFKDPGAFDLHLLPTAAAVNHGDPKAYPAVDIDGERRPRGRRPDAGADEVG